MIKSVILVLIISSILIGHDYDNHNLNLRNNYVSYTQVKRIGLSNVNNSYFSQSLKKLYRIEYANEKTLFFELGIRDDLIAAFTNQFDNPVYKNKIEFFYPINLHLSAGIRFLKQYKIDFRFGIMTNGDYIFGIDGGFFFQADLLKTDFYGTAGVDFFNNNLANSGITNADGTFTFYFLGLGYKASTTFDIDIMYGFPGKNKVYTTTPVSAYGIAGNQYFEDKINGLLKIGFQYSFIF